MPRIEAEKREYLSPVVKGQDVMMLKFRGTFNGEDMHYPGEMISGCKMMERCIDACTELCNIRDNGDGGLIVHTSADIMYPVHMLDAYEIICWVEKQGRLSRNIGYEMYKTSEYNQETDRSTVFEEPVLTVKGDVVFVVDEPAE